MKVSHLTYVPWSVFALYISIAKADDCIEESYKVVNCFKSDNITQRMWTNQYDIQAMWVEITAFDEEVHCLPEPMHMFTNAMPCVAEEMENCLTEAGLWGIQPDTEKVIAGYTAMCDVIEDFDGPCFQKQFPNIVKCGQWTTDNYLIGKAVILNDIICIFNDAIYDCAEYFLQSCSSNTTLMYLEILNSFLIPRECNERKKFPRRQNREKFELVTSGTIIHHTATCLFLFFINVFCIS